jgi:LmbE family N-acetylglucosaminyl deacetylase
VASAPAQRIVVVSPHLDDGVLSLGASMSAWARGGARVELLTVLAGDPASESPPGGWDARGGFATEGAASRSRRLEDARACALLGAVPVRLDFGYQDYERHGDEAEVRSAVVEAVADADAALLPGSPLTHPDHEWVVRTLGDAPLRARRLGFYLEQPYGLRSGAEASPPWLEVALGARLAFTDSKTGVRDLIAKARAVRAYASQLPLLALTARRVVQLARDPERIAWLDGSRL